MRFWKNCVLLNQEGKQPGTEGKGNVLSDVVTETRRGSSEEETSLQKEDLTHKPLLAR